MFRRKIYDELKNWKKSHAGEYALMLEGPRRVGKSTVIEEFVKNEYRSYVMIRFERTSNEIKELFKDMSDMDKFFSKLEIFTGTRLYARESAIVFDEVQLFPLARQAIKPLLEDGRYDYYETGSLISVKKNVENILIPSEEDSMYMHPMDFEEFLWANGDDLSMPFIQSCFERSEPLGENVHNRMMDLYRTYMMVGGMPQAVSKFLEKNSFTAAEAVKKKILNLYLKDAAKIDSDYRSDKAESILKSIPSNLEKHDKTFSPSLIRKDAKLRDLRRSISELEDSMMVNLCYRSTEPAVDQESHSDRNDFKMYLCDTGLLFTQSFSTLKYDSGEVFRSILKGDLGINEGMYFENMVAQELVMTGHPLFFSKFEHKDSKKLQEVDFVIVRNRVPTPVEVKSGKRPREHKSLDRYQEKYKGKLAKSYVICTKDLEVCDDATYIPIYMASLL